MRRLRLELIVPITFLLFAAFTLGFHARDVSAWASSGDTRQYLEALRLLPQRLESIASGGQKPETQDLPLIETYTAVVERLKADYYDYDARAAEVRKENPKTNLETELTYDAIRGALHALDDPFTRFLDPEDYKKMREENEGNFTGIGARLDTDKKTGEVRIAEPLPDTPAMRAGVKKNDVILAVDDEMIAGLDIQDVVEKIRGEIGTKVKLTLRRPGRAEPFDVVITRDVVPFRIVESEMLDEKNGIGYIKLWQFNEKSDVQFDEALTELEKKNLRGLVLDLRNNPGGLLQLAVDIGSRFLDNGNVVIIQERGGRRSPLHVLQKKHNHKRYPLAVLVNGGSASASEIVAGAIKDAGAGVLVGTTTFGKGRVQTIIPLQDGSAVAITTAKYLTPNGTDIHKKGIEPNVVVEQRDVEDILAATKADPEDIDPSDRKYDDQLNRAVEVVKVKMGLLPASVLNKLEQSAKARK
ncbi:MAG: hypothetical protein A2Z18_00665 [Armatimonadetes bacterium RBG_16_58_9]|nr:MAG: hypothetical protein A2Z18_00665 [Armatimonadetes bacterium RBG_16_58_9]